MIAVFFADGFEEGEGIVPVDLLRRAGLEVKTVSITDSNQVVGSHNITVETDLIWDEFEPENYDTLILPGGLRGTENLNNFAPLREAVKTHNSANKLCCAICAAPTIFGKLGILSCRKYTCFPGFEDASFGGEYQGGPVVHDGNIITARAMNASVEFAREIIKTLKPENLAQVEDGIQYE
jgi:4-methyl-5(b-hydroxyethyl)-thiazole monophosphate biosynthesis